MMIRTHGYHAAPSKPKKVESPKKEVAVEPIKIEEPIIVEPIVVPEYKVTKKKKPKVSAEEKANTILAEIEAEIKLQEETINE